MPTQRRLPGCRPGGGAGRQQGQGALSFHHARRGGGFRLLPPRARGGARLPREKLVFRSIQMVQCGAPPCLPGERACNQIGAGVPSPLFRRSRESGNLGISVTCPLFMPGAGSGPPLSRGRRREKAANLTTASLAGEGQDGGCSDRYRGRRIVTSVNSPGWLSTSIVPPCCWVTMSQLIESPRPVPSPV